MAKKKGKARPDPNEGLPLGATGVFVACSLNGDAHPECVAIEIHRTEDARGKIRHHAFCPFCNSRQFLNNWIAKDPKACKGLPRAGTMNLPQAEGIGLHCARITEERRVELLAELGLRMASPPGPPGPPSWHQPRPPIVPAPPPRNKKKGPPKAKAS